MSVANAALRRRSHAVVTQDAPSHDELLSLIEAAATVADHASLRPWRLIELRGDTRVRLGAALVEAAGLHDVEAERMAAKPLRASLLIAVVFAPKPSFKVAAWEQEAVAAGVAHLLSLLLDEAGWGVMWRTGGHTRSASVARVHDLAPDELLMGWLYIGGKTEATDRKTRGDVSELLTVL